MMGRATHRVTTDAIIRHEDTILLVKRAAPPFEGDWALPGGHIENGERPKEALHREIREETGLAIRIDRQLGEHAEIIEDPRGPVIPLTYLCTAETVDLSPATDAAEAKWFRPEEIPDHLAFNHHKVLEKHLDTYPST